MKILILSWRCIKNPQSGGSELYFHELAKEWVRSGNEVVWFSPEFPNCLREELIDGIRIIRRGGKMSVYIFAFLEYLKKRIPHDFDVVIDVENGIPFFSPLYIKNKKIFLHIHHVHKDVWFKETKFPINCIGYLLESWVMPFVYRKNEVITLSESSAKEIVEEKLSKKKPVAVPPGIEFYNLAKIKKSKNPSILFLNRIKKYKGIEIFLNAAKEMKKKYPNMEFWVAGSGDCLEKMKEYAKKNNLTNVLFFGRVNEKKKIELMQKAWLFVNPSFKEGWGIVNIEANYVGTPVIGSNVGGIRDSVIDGKTGLLFEYGNHVDLAKKIEFLIENKKLLKIMSNNGKKWAKEFAWEKKARQYLNLLKNPNQ